MLNRIRSVNGEDVDERLYSTFVLIMFENPNRQGQVSMHEHELWFHLFELIKQHFLQTFHKVFHLLFDAASIQKNCFHQSCNFLSSLASTRDSRMWKILDFENFFLTSGFCSSFIDLFWAILVCSQEMRIISSTIYHREENMEKENLSQF